MPILISRRGCFANNAVGMLTMQLSCKKDMVIDCPIVSTRPVGAKPQAKQRPEGMVRCIMILPQGACFHWCLHSVVLFIRLKTEMPPKPTHCFINQLLPSVQKSFGFKIMEESYIHQLRRDQFRSSKWFTYVISQGVCVRAIISVTRGIPNFDCDSTTRILHRCLFVSKCTADLFTGTKGQSHCGQTLTLASWL